MMSGLKIGAILLIAVGTLGLAFGAFSYSRETHHASVGPMEMSFSEKRTVNIPVWVGVGAIAVGAVLLVVGPKSKA
jgi:uncharacterized membrane protein YidH (DUF202 family)